MFERTISENARRVCSAAPVVVLGPEIVRITFRIGQNHDNEPAVFFNVLLSDDAAAERDTALRIRTCGATKQFCEAVCDAEEYGYRCFFSWRSESEQAKLKDPEWE